MILQGKTQSEIDEILAASFPGVAQMNETDRRALAALVHDLVTFEPLLTARQIAERTQCNKRDVLADMKAGRFVDPILGAGFFCRADNSPFKVSVSAANHWRRQWFAPIRRPAAAIPAKKKNAPTAQNGDRPEKTGQSDDRRACLGLMPDQVTHEAGEQRATESTTK